MSNTNVVADDSPRVEETARSVWELDPNHSLVGFGVKHMMFATVKGRFAGVSGTIVADEEDPSKAEVVVEIDVASVDTMAADRDRHLRSPDFFDVEHHPRITFRSLRVEPLEDGRFRLIGELTIRGVTREVALEGAFNGRGKNPWGQEVAGFSARGRINRRDFGLEWNAPLEAGGWLVGDDVSLELEVEAVKQAA